MLLLSASQQGCKPSSEMTRISSQEQHPVSAPVVVPQVPAPRSPRGTSRLLEALGCRQQGMRVDVKSAENKQDSPLKEL